MPKKAQKSDCPALQYVVWNAAFFPVVAVPATLFWAVRNGWLGVMNAWVMGIITTLVMGWVLILAVRWLAENFINRNGCAVSMMSYWGSPLLLALFWWQGGFDLLVIGLFLVPVLVVIIGMIITKINPAPRDRNWPCR